MNRYAALLSWLPAARPHRVHGLGFCGPQNQEQDAQVCCAALAVAYRPPVLGCWVYSPMPWPAALAKHKGFLSMSVCKQYGNAYAGTAACRAARLG